MCFIVVLSWFVSNMMEDHCTLFLSICLSVSLFLFLSLYLIFVRKQQESRTNDCTRGSRYVTLARLRVVEFSRAGDVLFTRETWILDNALALLSIVSKVS